MIFLFQGCIPRFHVNLSKPVQGLLANFMANFIASNWPATVTPSMVVIGSETPPPGNPWNNLKFRTYIDKVWLVGGFKYFLFSSILGEDSHFDDHIFQRGWNHQPDGNLPMMKWESPLKCDMKKILEASMQVGDFSEDFDIASPTATATSAQTVFAAGTEARCRSRRCFVLFDLLKTWEFEGNPQHKNSGCLVAWICRSGLPGLAMAVGSVPRWGNA